MPEHVIEGVLAGDIEPTLQAIKEAKVVQRKAEEELYKSQKERRIVKARVLNINYEEQILREELRKIKEERDHLKREPADGLEAYYEKNL